MVFAIPLAWLQLRRERIRLLVALAGIGFAVILMFMQLGFRDALLESSVVMHRQLNTDVVLISPQSNALIAMDQISRRRLYQALGFPEVESISPLYLDFALWQNPDTRITRSIMVMGFPPQDKVFDIAAVQDNISQITLEDVVLFDRASREEFGPVAEWFEAGRIVTTEVGNRRVQVGGLFELGASFGADGNLITSDINFLRIFERRSPAGIDAGLIRLKPETDPELVVEAMRQALPDDVLVLTKEGFMDFERNYWQSSTAIGFIFSLGAMMGFIVGTVIVYQILYTDVSDHLAEYATLKAMGYTNRYLLVVVFQEALILSVLGYIPGFALCLGLYDLTENATSLPISMTLARSSLIFGLTILMCCISGAIAVRKVQEADPADVF